MYIYIRSLFSLFFFFNDTPSTEIYTLSLHDALPISSKFCASTLFCASSMRFETILDSMGTPSNLEWFRSEEHTSELQSHSDLVCRLLLEKKKKKRRNSITTITTSTRRSRYTVLVIAA